MEAKTSLNQDKHLLMFENLEESKIFATKALGPLSLKGFMLYASAIIKSRLGEEFQIVSLSTKRLHQAEERLGFNVRMLISEAPVPNPEAEIKAVEALHNELADYVQSLKPETTT